MWDIDCQLLMEYEERVSLEGGADEWNAVTFSDELLPSTPWSGFQTCGVHGDSVPPLETTAANATLESWPTPEEVVARDTAATRARQACMRSRQDMVSAGAQASVSSTACAMASKDALPESAAEVPATSDQAGCAEARGDDPP